MMRRAGRRATAAGRHWGILVVILLVSCSGGSQEDLPSQATSSEAVPTEDIMGLEYFAPLEASTYSIYPDYDPSTPLRVVYKIPAEGWSMWIGAVKFADDGHVGLSITTVSNLVRHGCRDHAWADPPVGPSVDDLAAALADLAPFRVTSPPEDVSIYGYSGKYLELTVPNLPVRGGLHGMRRGEPQELGRFHRHDTGGRVLRLHGSRLHRGVLVPRRRRHPSDDRGGMVSWLAARGPRRAALDPGLHPDRAVRSLETESVGQSFSSSAARALLAMSRTQHLQNWPEVLRGGGGTRVNSESPAQGPYLQGFSCHNKAKVGGSSPSAPTGGSPRHLGIGASLPTHSCMPRHPLALGTTRFVWRIGVVPWSTETSSGYAPPGTR